MDAALEGDVQVGVGEVEGGFDLFFGFGIIVYPGADHHMVFVEFVIVEYTDDGNTPQSLRVRFAVCLLR